MQDCSQPVSQPASSYYSCCHCCLPLVLGIRLISKLSAGCCLLGAACACSYQLMITTYSNNRYPLCTAHIYQVAEVVWPRPMAAVAAMAAMPESLAAAASGRGGLDSEVMFMHLPIPILLRNIAQSAIISLPPLLSLPLARVHIVLCARIEFSGGCCDP